MGRQRNRPQIKAKEKSPETELNEMEANNLSDIEFKVMVIRVLRELTENYNHTKRHRDHEKRTSRK